MFTGISIFLIFGISFATEFSQIVILRLLFGVVVGATNPLGYVYVTEVAVTKYRGRFAFSMTLMFVAGKIYLVALCFIFLDDYTSGNWRELIRFNSVPLIVCFLSSLVFLRETIRYYLNKGHYATAFEEIENVIARNQGQVRKLQENEVTVIV